MKKRAAEGYKEETTFQWREAVDNKAFAVRLESRFPQRTIWFLQGGNADSRRSFRFYAFCAGIKAMVGVRRE